MNHWIVAALIVVPLLCYLVGFWIGASLSLPPCSGWLAYFDAESSTGSGRSPGSAPFPSARDASLSTHASSAPA